MRLTPADINASPDSRTCQTKSTSSNPHANASPVPHSSHYRIKIDQLSDFCSPQNRQIVACPYCLILPIWMCHCLKVRKVKPAVSASLQPLPRCLLVSVRCSFAADQTSRSILYSTRRVAAQHSLAYRQDSVPSPHQSRNF